MTIRALVTEECPAALDLAWKVFSRFEAPEYSAEGIANFKKTIRDPSFTGRLRYYGAFEQRELVGMLATRDDGQHITLFFVDEAYHRHGIGRALFTAALADVTGNRITVNSSPYAVEIYRRLGFTATKAEQLTDGIRYTPMLYHIR